MHNIKATNSCQLFESIAEEVWQINLQGKPIVSFVPKGSEWQADLSPIVDGLYIIQAQGFDGHQFFKKVIKAGY